MHDALFNKVVNCPVCRHANNFTKVKMRFCRIKSKDTDFCVHYKSFNPILYDAWVCEKCGYASLSKYFLDILESDKKTILNTITPKWIKHSYSGERNLLKAIAAFKIVLFNYQTINYPKSLQAKVAIRLAWLFRYSKNSKLEKEFLEYAYQNYMDAYQKEHFPFDKLDEYTCMYLIGELAYRLNYYEESKKWFSLYFSSKDARKNKLMFNQAQERYFEIRENKNYLKKTIQE
jgi:uncharacterized protein (DUF2225 family)